MSTMATHPSLVCQDQLFFCENICNTRKNIGTGMAPLNKMISNHRIKYNRKNVIP